MSTMSLPMFLLAETVSAAELPRLLWRMPALMRQPKGHGEPVIVLPGFATGDPATLVLRTYLSLLGYDVRGWGRGVNLGDIDAAVPEIAELVRGTADETGQRVRLIGWSLGGVIAREVARDNPDVVERVITLGSPVCGGFKHTAARYWYALRRCDLDSIEKEIDERNRILLKVPVTAICASYDGIVQPEGWIDPHSKVEHLEVGTTHIGLGINPEVYRIIAQRLAIPTARRRRYARQVRHEQPAREPAVLQQQTA